MTLKNQNSRFRAAAAALLAVIAGLGLAASSLLDSWFQQLPFTPAPVEAATRESYTLTSAVPLPLMPNVMIEGGKLSIDKPGRANDGLSGSQAIKLLAAGDVKLLLDDAVLSIAPIQSTDPATVKAGGSLAPILSALLKLSFSTLELRNASVKLGRGVEPFATLADVDFKITKPNTAQARAVGSFKYRDRPVTFDIMIGANAELQAEQARGTTTIGRTLDIVFKSELFSLTGSGILSAGDQPQLTSKSATLMVEDLRQLANWIGFKLGDGTGVGGVSKFQAQGLLDFSPQSIEFSEAKLQLDSNDATGAISFNWGGTRPSLDGTLAFKALELSNYLPAARPDAAKGFDLASLLKLRPESKSPFPLVNQIDADLRVSSARVSLGSMSFGRGAASLSLKDGVLLADVAELEIGKDGRCGGQFGFQMEGQVPSYSLRGKIESIDISMLMNALWSYSIVSGNSDVTIDLKAAGDSKEKMLSSLQGRVGVIQPGSGQIGLDLRTLAATTRAQMQKGWGGATRGQTAIDGLAAEFFLVDGRLIAEKVGARAGDAVLSAVGSINVRDQVGDLKVFITHPQRDANATDVAPLAARGLEAANSNERGNAAGAAGAEPKVSGGGLQVKGPLTLPEIRFIPLSPPPASNVQQLPSLPPSDNGKS